MLEVTKHALCSNNPLWITALDLSLADASWQPIDSNHYHRNLPIADAC